MKDRSKTKRRVLTASAGVVAFTAFEGLACGNPVAPSYEVPRNDPTATATEAPTTAPPATATASATTGVAPAADHGVPATSRNDPAAGAVVAER